MCRKSLFQMIGKHCNCNHSIWGKTFQTFPLLLHKNLISKASWSSSLSILMTKTKCLDHIKSYWLLLPDYATERNCITLQVSVLLHGCYDTVDDKCCPSCWLLHYYIKYYSLFVQFTCTPWRWWSGCSTRDGE